MSPIGGESFLGPVVRFLLVGAWENLRDRLRAPHYAALNAALREVARRHPALGMMELSAQALVQRDLPSAEINPLIQLLDETLTQGRLPTKGELADLLIARWRAINAALPDPAPLFDLPAEQAEELMGEIAVAFLRQLSMQPRFALPEVVSALQESQRRQVRLQGEGRGAGDSPIQLEISAAAANLDGGKVDTAITLLQSVESRYGDKLTPYDKYRIGANLGNAHAMAGRLKEAAKLYLKAHREQPDRREAREYAALAYYWLNDHESARTELDRLLSQGNPSERTWMLHVRTSEEGFEALLTATQKAHLLDAEVAVALCERAYDEGRFVDGEGLVRATLDAGETWPALHQAIGVTLLAEQLAAQLPSIGLPILANPRRVEEAVDFFNAALDSEDPMSRVASFREANACNKALALQLLGRHEEALAALDSEFKRTTASEVARQAYYRSLLELGGGAIKEAVKLLEGIAAPEDPIAHSIHLSRALFRLQPHDALGAIKEHLAWAFSVEAEATSDDYRRATNLLAEAAVNANDVETLESLLERVVPLHFSGVERDLIRGKLLHSLDRREEAAEAALAALSVWSKSTGWSLSCELGHLLYGVGRVGEAFSVLSQAITPTLMAPEVELLLEVAAAADESKFLLDFCRRLRDNGIWARAAVDHEFLTLMRFHAFAAAARLVEEFLSQNPDDPFFYLRSLQAGMKAGEGSVVDVSRLPSVAAVKTSNTGLQVAQIIASSGALLSALDYLYHLFRRFSDDERVAEALCGLILVRGGEIEIESPPTVEDGTAIMFRREDGTTGWIVLESEAPRRSADEWAWSSDVAGALSGKAAGDSFALSESPLAQEAVILAIYDKRLGHALRLRDGFQSLFPTSSFLISADVGASEQGAGGPAKLVEILERVSRPKASVRDLLRSTPLPAALVAARLGETVFETLRGLALDADLRVIDGPTSPEDLKNAKEMLGTSETVVLGPESLTTLVLLDQVEVLAGLKCRVVVTESSLQELEAQIQIPGTASGSIGVSGGRLVGQFRTAEEMESLRTKVRGILKFLRETCEVVDGLALARLPAPVRSAINDCFPPSAAESLATACELDVPLLSDDGVSASFEDLPPCRRIWTYAMLNHASETGVMTREDFSYCSAMLLAFRYEATRFGAATLAEALNRCSWHAQDWVVRCLLEALGNPTRTSEEQLRLAAAFSEAVIVNAPTDDCCLELHRRIAVEVGRRSDRDRVLELLSKGVLKLSNTFPYRVEAVATLFQGYRKGHILFH